MSLVCSRHSKTASVLAGQGGPVGSDHAVHCRHDAGLGSARTQGKQWECESRGVTDLSWVSKRIFLVRV